MNINQQFDEHIKEQFNNYSPDVHPRIWENIIAEKERRKPAGFWLSLFNRSNKLLFLGLLIAISSGGALIYFSNYNNRDKTQIAIENNKSKKGIDNNNLSNKTDITDQEAATILIEKNNSKQPTNTTLHVNPALSSTGVAKVSNYSPSHPSNDDENTTINNNSSSKKGKKELSGLLIINTEAPGLNDDDFITDGTLLGRLTFNAQNFSANQKSKKQTTLSFNPIIYLPDCPSLEKDAAANKKYLEFYAGPDYAFLSLRDTGNSVYLQKRKESTKFKSAYSAGIRYTKVFNNSMSVRGGVNYSQINEKFTFSQGSLVQITYIIDANGDTTGSYITTGTRYKTTINRYRSIDIPVIFGYELGNGKLHVNINAGVVVNIYSWQSGDVLDTAYRPVNITTGKSSSPYQFKTNAGIGFIGAVSVYYKLNDKIHVMAEPYFRYNFSSMNKERITLKQKYQIAGLRLGIRLDLK